MVAGTAQEALEAYAAAGGQWFQPRAGWAETIIADSEEPKDEESQTFLISASRHACTDPAYRRLGLVGPRRTSGGGRRYSLHDVELLRQVQHLSQDEGQQPGIKRIIELTSQVEASPGCKRWLSWRCCVPTSAAGRSGAERAPPGRSARAGERARSEGSERRRWLSSR